MVSTQTPKCLDTVHVGLYRPKYDIFMEINHLNDYIVTRSVRVVLVTCHSKLEPVLNISVLALMIRPPVIR